MIQYTNTASVSRIMDLIGTHGVNNTPDGLYIYRSGTHMIVKKGEFVGLEDGVLTIYPAKVARAMDEVMGP